MNSYKCKYGYHDTCQVAACKCQCHGGQTDENG